MADIYVATTGSDTTGNGTSGNPYATPGKAGSVMVGGDRILIKAGTYTLTSTTANVAGGALNPPAGTSAAPSRVVGYNATVGDLDAVNDFSNFPTLAAAAAFAVSPITVGNAHCHLFNLDLDAANQSNRALLITGSNALVVNCRGRRALFFGFDIQGVSILLRCHATGNGTSGAAFDASIGCIFDSCVAQGNTNPGFKLDGGRSSLHRCMSYGNTGATVDGLIVTGTSPPWLRHCVFRGNGRDGVRFNDASGGDTASVRNCISYGNTGSSFKSAVTTYIEMDFDYNAYVAASLSGVPAGAHDVVLTGDPFTNAAGGDFSLNNTAGAGAALRALGFPGVFPLGLTTGYPDIGAAQHQDAGGGGGGGLLTHPGMSGRVAG
jgi:hypothetical protein